jgi:O-antigen/teichoic acid export membrane protein
MSARNLLVRAIGFVGTIVLARLLTPADYGLLALGFAIVLLGNYLGTAGLGASLVRRQARPTRDELGSVLGFQLLATGGLALLIGAVGLAVGGAGTLAAIMAVSLPLTALRVPTGVMLERDLRFGPMMRAEVLETLVYNGGAIALVLAGTGLWGVAAATVIGPAVGTAALILSGSVGVPSPRLSWHLVRPILRFGLAFQSVSLASTARDQGLNMVVGAAGGAAVLGIWAIAYRLLQAVLLLLEALWRVSFPTMSRLVEMGEDAARLLQRALRLTSVAVGVPVVALAGSAGALVPTIFGERWDPVIPVLPLGAAALMISGPVSTTAIGFLLAKGEAGRVLRVVVVQGLLWICVAAALIPIAGALAGGVGMVAGSVSVALMLTRFVNRHAPLRLVPNVWRSTAAALAGSLVGWGLVAATGDGPFALVVSLAAAEAVYLAGVWLAQRDTALLAGRTLKQAVAR